MAADVNLNLQGRLRTIPRTPLWGVLDSAVGSLLTFVVVVASTRISGVETVGQVALVSSVVLACLGFFRLGIAIPYLKVIGSGNESASRLVVGVAVVPVLAVALIGLTIGGAVGSSIIVSGAFWLAAALLQEAYRNTLMVAMRYGALLMADVVGLVVTTILLPVCHSTVALVMALFAGCLAASGAGALLARGIPGMSIRASIRHWRDRLGRHAGPLMLDGVVFTIAAQGLLWVLAARASVAEVGIYRLALMIAFPLGVVQAGITTPILQRLARTPRAQTSRIALRWSLLLGAGAAGIAIFSLVFLPLINTFLVDPPSYVTLVLAALVLLNAVSLFAYEPISRSCVLVGQTLSMAWWRAVSGTVSLILVFATPWGLSSQGAAAAVLAGTLVFGIALLRLNRVKRAE
jgi:O-antigen/teichoic acid export membrane protein